MDELIDGAHLFRESFLSNPPFSSPREEGILASKFQRENKLGARGSAFPLMYYADNSKYEKLHLPGHSLMHKPLGQHLG